MLSDTLHNENCKTIVSKRESLFAWLNKKLKLSKFVVLHISALHFKSAQVLYIAILCVNSCYIKSALFYLP